MNDPQDTVIRPQQPLPAHGTADGDAEATRVRRPRVALPIDDDLNATVVRPRWREPIAAPTAARPAPDNEPTLVMRRPPVSGRAAMPAPSSPDADATRVRPAGAAAAQSIPTLTPSPDTAIALPEGFRLHEYRIERVLGQGGFGITYLATDVNLHARVAIKEYLPADIAWRDGDHSVAPRASQHGDRYRSGLDSFLVEARTLATFRHPNIVRVARFFEAHRTAYMVLEYERGSPLRHWWPEHRQIGERGLVERLQPLLDGLSVVHQAGFLHRDIKPDNIQVREDDGRFVLLDFGSAGQTVALADQDAVIVTPGFAPIEQYGLGEQGAWTDIYALGATLYWALGGHKPPDAEARAAGVPMRPATELGAGVYGEAFLKAIDWSLRPDAAQRPRSIAQWREQLFADHLATIGLKEALQRGEAAADDTVPGAPRARVARQLASRWRATVSLPDWPLALKLTLAMLVTALLPMLVTAFYNLDGSRRALQASQLRTAELLAHNTAGRLSQLLGDSTKLARALGTDADFAQWLARPDEAGKEALRAKLLALAQANADIHLVMVMDTGGTTLVSNDPATMGRNFRFRQYFQEAAAGRPFVSGVVVGAVAGAAGVFFAEPVRNAQGQVIGAVVLRIRASSFAAILDEVRHDANLTPFLIDGDGVIVHHPREDLLYQSLMPLTPAALERVRADQRFRRDRIASLDEPVLAAAMLGAKQAGHVAYRSAARGIDEIAGFAPVPQHDWVVGISETRASFEAPLDTLYRHLLWSVAIAGAVASALALRFGRGIVRPIQALTAGAHALKAGDFERAHVDVKGRDELGQLARTFNVMVDVLRQRERERR